MEKHFARTEMLPPLAPPVTERGAVKWLRENLFSGWFNTILTLIGIYVVWSLVTAALPWWMNSVWTANSLSECRAIVVAQAGEGATGACWAMVNNWWNAFIFGFYPVDGHLLARLFDAEGFAAAGGYDGLFGPGGDKAAAIAYMNGLRETVPGLWFNLVGYWRPIAAFLFLIAALSPVLFTGLPRRMLVFTALYPALCFWLLWGGSVWVPVVAMLGFVVLGGAYVLLNRSTGPGMAAGVGIVLALLWWLFLDKPLTDALQGLLPFGLASVNSDQFGGFLLAITIGVTAITFSLPLGILLALGRQSDMLIVKTLCVGFIEFIRGVPLITLLFTASLLLQYFLPPNTNFDIILRVIILVTLFAAAYLAEVIRGGLAALPRGQYEAADALGLDYWRAQRLIILPQALKISIPSIVSTFIGLFKDTTLVAFVGLMDPLKGVTQIVRADINWKGIYWEPYIFVGVIFFVICFGMSRYSMYLERKLKTDHR